MAVNRTVLANGTVQPQHGAAAETDVDANWALQDQWQGGRMFADLGISGVASGLALSTSATLTPGLAAGTLYAQGQRVPFASAPAPGAAPANGTNYLFYNSATGFYYQASAIAATTGDALIGQVVTNASAVTAVTNATPIMGEVSLAPANAGNFTTQHFLGRTPVVVIVNMTSDGTIWRQASHKDATNLYLVASIGGITGKALIW